MSDMWTTKRLGDVAEIVTGNTPSKKEPENYGHQYLWIRPEELGSATPIKDSKIKLSNFGVTKARLLPKDSVLVCCIGSVGKIGFAGVPLTTNQQINSAIFNEKIFPRYGYYFLLHQAKRLQEKANNSVVAIINKTDFSNLEIRYPSYKEQRRIAAILDKADAIRRKQEQALALADDFLRATFLDMFGDAVTNPMGWEIGEFGCAILTANNGLSRRRKIEQNIGEIVLRIKDLQANKILTNHPNRITLDSAEKKKFLLQNRDLLLVRVNGNPDYVGRCAVFTDVGEEVAHNDHIIRIKLNELINPFFASYQFNHTSGKRLLSPAIKTSAGQYTISRDGLEKVKLPIPPRKLQDAFEARSALIRKSTINILRGLDLANNNFVSVSQRAFKGEL